jgi:hypothetical protein
MVLIPEELDARRPIGISEVAMSEVASEIHDPDHDSGSINLPNAGKAAVQRAAGRTDFRHRHMKIGLNAARSFQTDHVGVAADGLYIADADGPRRYVSDDPMHLQA